MLRSILSVIIGWLVYGISIGILIIMTGIDPHGESSVFFNIGSSLYGIVFSFLGGFITALIVKHRHFIHSVALALLYIFIAISAMSLTDGTHWSEWVSIIVFAPFVALGGWIRVKNMNK